MGGRQYQRRPFRPTCPAHWRFGNVDIYSSCPKEGSPSAQDGLFNVYVFSRQGLTAPSILKASSARSLCAWSTDSTTAATWLLSHTGHSPRYCPRRRPFGHLRQYLVLDCNSHSAFRFAPSQTSSTSYMPAVEDVMLRICCMAPICCPLLFSNDSNILPHDGVRWRQGFAVGVFHQAVDLGYCCTSSYVVHRLTSSTTAQCHNARMRGQSHSVLGSRHRAILLLSIRGPVANALLSSRLRHLVASVDWLLAL